MGNIRGMLCAVIPQDPFVATAGAVKHNFQYNGLFARRCVTYISVLFLYHLGAILPLLDIDTDTDIKEGV